MIGVESRKLDFLMEKNWEISNTNFEMKLNNTRGRLKVWIRNMKQRWTLWELNWMLLLNLWVD